MRDIIRHSIMSLCRLKAIGGCTSSGPPGSNSERRVEAGPITVIVPFPPGGVDLQAKKMLPEFSRLLGVPVNLVNRPGNSGTIGTIEASRAAPDGRTLLFAPQGPMAYQPAITPLAYNPARSFVPICRVSVGPSVLMASERSGFRSAKDVVAAAKASPGNVTYSSPGVGSLPHVVMATFCQLAGVRMRHATAAGAAAAVAALKNGTAEVLAENVPLAIANSGKDMRIIGQFAANRLRELPEVPTLAEQGFDVTFNEWTALFAPAGTPPATVSRLEAACKAALGNADVVASMMSEFKSPPAYLPSSDMLSFLSSEYAIAQEHVRKSGLVQGNLLVSVNDAKMTNVGELKVVPNPGPDTLTLIDVEKTPPQIRSTVNVPATIIGPPLSVALTPDESLALVTSGSKADPADPTKLAPDNRLSVVDLRVNPPQIVQTLELGSDPQGVSINRMGNLALVANHNSGTVSVLGIGGKNVKALAAVAVGTAASGLSHVAITPNGRHALVTREGDHMISVLRIEGEKVEYTKRDITAGIRPYGVMISPDGSYAVVANMGRPQGDSSIVSLIDLRTEPFRTVDSINVGPMPEGLAISPDGRLVAVGLVDGSTKPEGDPFKTLGGRLILLKVGGMKLYRISEIAIGSWVQGVVFARDSQRIYVQNATDKEIQVVHVDQDRLVDKGERIHIGTAGAALRASY